MAHIGIASGAVIGSVVGVQKYIYDVFGPAVTAADKVQGSAPDMKIAVHGSTAALLDTRFVVEGSGDDEAPGLLGEAGVASNALS